MANEYGIQGFHLSGMPSAPASWIGMTVAGHTNYATYDFLDAYLNDAALTPNTADRIRYNGVSYQVKQILVIGLDIIDKHGKTYNIPAVAGTNASGFRAYDLGGGQFILRPLDNTFNLPALPDYKSWVSFHFTNVYTTPGTTITAQDAPFPLCFVAGTRILTPRGERRVEKLLPGDLVMTRDHGAQPLVWVGRMRLDPARTAAEPRLAPIVITPGALGPGMPQTTLCVSPQHRILLRNPVAAQLFGSDEVLCPAKALVGRPGISRDAPRADTHYVHLLLDRHEVLVADGAEAESFFPGPQALAALDPEALEELDALFPGLDLQLTRNYTPARPFVRGQKLAQLLARIGAGALTLPLETPQPAAAG